MKKILKGALSILLSVALTVPVFSIAAFAEENPTVKVPVTITLTGSKPSTPETLNVVMKPADSADPMPEGTVDGVYTLATAGAGDYEMAPITFNRVGIHDYTIYQEPGTHKKGTYDEKVYGMTIFVTNAENGGGLETTVIMHLDGVEAKPGKVEFTNSYRSSGGGGGGGSSSGGGGSSSGGGGSTPSGGSGATEISDADTPLATILPFDIPLALPQTGTLWWLVPILAIAGLVMFFGGVMKDRKRGEDEEI